MFWLRNKKNIFLLRALNKSPGKLEGDDEGQTREYALEILQSLTDL